MTNENTVETIEEIANQVIAKLDGVKVEFPQGWEELGTDELLQHLDDEDDPEGYDFVLSASKPKGARVIGGESEDLKFGKVEAYAENSRGRTLTKEEEEELKSYLPKYITYIWSDKEHIGFSSGIFKGMKPWLVAKPGWKGPQEELPDNVAFSCTNGLKIMKLESVDQIKTEGRFQTHCVGRSSMNYIQDFKDGKSEFYSLYSTDDLPLITMEVSVAEKRVRGAYGKKNRRPGCGYGSSTVTKPEEIVAIDEWKNAVGLK